MEMTYPKPIYTANGKDLKGILESLSDARDRRNQYKYYCSMEYGWVYCKNVIKVVSSKQISQPKVET
jgi:hypothetical protein